MTGKVQVLRELFEQSVRGDLIPCVPPDRLDLATERVVSNPHLRILAELARNGEVTSVRLAETLARTVERAEAAKAERDRFAEQVQRVRTWLAAMDDESNAQYYAAHVAAAGRRTLDGVS